MRSLTLLDERGAMPSLQALSEQDATRPVVLIGFQKQGNLGIGYLAATLMRSRSWRRLKLKPRWWSGFRSSFNFICLASVR